MQRMSPPDSDSGANAAANPTAINQVVIMRIIKIKRRGMLTLVGAL